MPEEAARSGLGSNPGAVPERENGEDEYVIEALERLYDWDPSYHSSM